MEKRPPAKATLLLAAFIGFLCTARATARVCTAAELTEMSACLDDIKTDDGKWKCADYKKAITICYPLCICDGDEDANDVKQIKKVEDDYKEKCDGEAKCASKGTMLVPAFTAISFVTLLATSLL